MSPKPGRIRIIGGEWRSRIVPVPHQVELRPTTDRIRETLFNWLAPYIQDANCLDVCSGSGILALEAISRGAHSVTAIDLDPAVEKHLHEQVRLFQTTQIHIIRDDVVRFLSHSSTQKFDIVFVDPPFASGLWEPICNALVKNHWLSPNALIYVEMPIQEKLTLPETWEPLKQKRAGHVSYELWIQK